MDAIDRRRSIRRFSDKEIPHEVICKIVEGGIKAPSAKNRQPWKFMVIQGQAKENMLRAFQAGIQREKAGKAMLPDSSRHLGGAEYTVQIMEQAPVVIFVLNPLGKGMFSPLNDEDRIYELCNIQSVSAAIENMLLEATDMGIGSLWICDIFFAYEELCAWMDCGDELVAAVPLVSGGIAAATSAQKAGGCGSLEALSQNVGFGNGEMGKLWRSYCQPPSYVL